VCWGVVVRFVVLPVCWGVVVRFVVLPVCWGVVVRFVVLPTTLQHTGHINLHYMIYHLFDLHFK
jgi:hypothetical protein